MLPTPLKIVGDGVLGNLAKPRKQQKSITNVAKSIGNKMSPCVSKMFYAVTEPWSPRATGACIPTFPARPSHKVTAFSRFDIAVGTQGIGFLTVAPTVANDIYCFVHSTAAFTGSNGPSDVTFAALTGVPATTGVIASKMGNLPYSAATLTTSTLGEAPQAHGRIISTSFSASYTGTTLDQSGLFFCYSDPAHDNVSSYSLNTLGARTECEITGVTREKCWVTCYPITHNECQYDRESTLNTSFVSLTTAQGQRSNLITSVCPFSDGDYYNTSAAAVTAASISSSIPAAPMVLIISGAVPGSTVHIEVVTHAEYIGYACEGRTTSSGFDSVGTETLLAALGKLPALKQSKPTAPIGQLVLEGMKMLKTA